METENRSGSVLFIPGFGERFKGPGGYGKFSQILANEMGVPVLTAEVTYDGRNWPRDPKGIREMLSDRVNCIYTDLVERKGAAITTALGHSHGALQLADAQLPVRTLALVNPPLYKQSNIDLNSGFLWEGLEKVRRKEVLGLTGYTLGLMGHLGRNARNALLATPAIAEGIECDSLPDGTKIFYSDKDRIFRPEPTIKAVQSSSKRLKLVLIEGGHTGILENPKSVVPTIAAELFSS